VTAPEGVPVKTLEEYADDLRASIGSQYRNEWSVEMFGPDFPRPLVAYATAAHDDQIRRFVDATGSLDPIHRDPEYAASSVRGGLIAPPTYLYAVAYGYYPNPKGYPPLRQYSGLYVGDSWRWYDDIRVDDRFDWVTSAPLDVTVKDTKSVGPAAFIRSRHDYYRKGTDELVASNTFTTIVRDADFRSGKKPHEPVAHTPEYIRSVYEAQDAELVRGREPRYFEDVVVGEQLPPVVRGPMTEMEYVTWIIAPSASGTSSPTGCSGSRSSTTAGASGIRSSASCATSTAAPSNTAAAWAASARRGSSSPSATGRATAASSPPSTSATPARVSPGSCTGRTPR